MNGQLHQSKTSSFGLARINIDEGHQLAALCRLIYSQYYLYLWFDAGEWYQQTRYNVSVLTDELSSPLTEFYWILRDSQKVGYMKINLQAWPSEVKLQPESRGMEIERIYIHAGSAGLGLGKKTMEWAEQYARQGGYHYLFLYTMDSSDARSFYEKMGYQKVAAKRLPFEQMKPEFRGMYLMTKELQ